MREETVFMLFAATVALILVVAFLVMRHQKEILRHRERLATLDKGLPPLPEPPRVAPHRVYLLRGMIWTLVGVVLMLFLTISIAATSTRRPDDLMRMRLYRQKELKDLGATEQQIAEVDRQQTSNPPLDGPPAVVGLIGLVPAAVGVAYLLFYRSEERRLREGQASSAASGS